MCISRSEIKIELILCIVLAIPVKTKYVSMYNIRNTIQILMILCELNALMYAKLALYNIKMNNKIHVNINLKFFFT